jgi:hypothetical protein
VDYDVVNQLFGNLDQFEVQGDLSVAGAASPTGFHLAYDYLGRDNFIAFKSWIPGGNSFGKNKSGSFTKPTFQQPLCAFRIFLVGRINKELVAVRKLYEFSQEIADEMVWGTGSIRGSFNPTVNAINTQTFYGVFSNGNLQFHHNLMQGDEVFGQWRDNFEKGLKSLTPIKQMFSQRKSKTPEIPPSAWAPVVDELIEILREYLVAYGATPVDTLPSFKPSSNLESFSFTSGGTWLSKS